LRLSFSYAEPSAPASSSLTLEVPADAQERKRRAILCHASQLRWRRAKLLASVGRREVFRRVTELTDQDPGPPLREVILDPQMLCVRFGPSLGRLFAACVMWIAIQDQVRGPIRLSTRLPLVDDRAPVRDVLRGETVGHATLDRSMLCLEVPLALPMPRSGFVRLDRPLRRRIGFIYGSGWHRVEIACERPAERRLEARPRPRVIESVAHY